MCCHAGIDEPAPVQQLTFQQYTADAADEADSAYLTSGLKDLSIPANDIDAIWRRITQPAPSTPEQADKRLDRNVSPASVLIQRILSLDSSDRSSPSTSPRAPPITPWGVPQHMRSSQ